VAFWFVVAGLARPALPQAVRKLGGIAAVHTQVKHMHGRKRLLTTLQGKQADRVSQLR
jgi:hypothetical protein